MTVPTPATLTATLSVLGADIPMWVDRNGRTWGRNGSSLLVSDDDWATTSTVAADLGTSAISAMRDLDDGTMLVALDKSDFNSNPGSLLRSDTTLTTWTEVLETSSHGASIIPRTIDTFGPYVLVGEYGSKDGVTNARRVSLSTDWGATFAHIYDHGAIAGAHVHGVCIDPRTSRLWVTTGDRGYRSIRWAPLGDPTNWTVVHDDTQPTVPCVIGKWVLFGTDDPPNGLLAYPREADFDVTTRYQIDLNPSQLTYVAQMSHRRPGVGMPLLIPYRTAQDAQPGVLLGTVDGVNVYELWRDSETYNSPDGFLTAFGPTANGTILGTVARSGVSHLFSAPAPTWG